MKKIIPFCIFIYSVFFILACDKDDNTQKETQLKFQFRFDEDQVRLDNFGEASLIPAGNAAQTPEFHALSVYYIELVPSKFTQIREGEVIYEAETQTDEGNGSFEDAVIFDKAIVSDENQTFLSLDLKNIPPGDYPYLRVSIGYQNAGVRFNILNIPEPINGDLKNQSATLAGFIGFNTFIKDVLVGERTLSVNGDRQQGFWAFEPQLDEPYQSFYLNYVNASGVLSGQVPAGAVTVVNPLSQFGVELPFGSCIVTGAFEGQALHISGDETEDILLSLSFSVNQSFEWEDYNNNGEWDLDLQSGSIEPLADMGLRGLIIYH